jgi:hypothetical protein
LRTSRRRPILQKGGSQRPRKAEDHLFVPLSPFSLQLFQALARTKKNRNNMMRDFGGEEK